MRSRVGRKKMRPLNSREAKSPPLAVKRRRGNPKVRQAHKCCVTDA